MSKKPVLTDEQTGEVIGGGLAKANPNATVNPTVTDDDSAGYAVGSVWLNATSGVSFNCTDATTGAAVWIAIGGGAADMEKATYDPTNIEADAFARANHTGTQLAATVSDFDSSVGTATVPAANAAFVSGDGASNTSHRTTVTGNPHAVSGDELNSDAQPAGKIIETDGAGGFVYLDTPSGGGSAAGTDRQIQFNDAGSFGALEFFDVNATAGFSVVEDETPSPGVNLTRFQGRGSLIVADRVSAGLYGSAAFSVGDGYMKGCLVFGSAASDTGYGTVAIRPRKGLGSTNPTGSLVGGNCGGTGGGAGDSTIETYGSGNVAIGDADGTGGNGRLIIGSGYNPHRGSVAMGSAENGEISCDTGASRRGAFAMGRAISGNIQANADGAFAMGAAIGYGNVVASANGAFMLNRGTNSVADSVSFGGGGYGGNIHILGGSLYYDPGSPVNGQFWATYNFYYGTHAIKCRVNGVTKDLTNIP